jgi:hypothetical protein
MKNRREHFVDGRRFGPGKLLLLTQGWWNRSWRFGPSGFDLVRPGRSPGDTGRDKSVRGRATNLARAENAVAKGARVQVTRPVTSSTKVEGERGRYRLKLEERRQAHLHPGPDCRKAVRRRSSKGFGVKTSGRLAKAVIAAKAAGSGIDRLVGCSLREVGCRSR